MLALVRQRLVIKLGILMVITVAAGFLGSAMFAAHRQRILMDRQHEQSATLFARGLAAGVRSSMITGDPLTTRDLLGDVNRGLGLAHVRVFAPGGDEVFAPRPPPPDPATIPASLRSVLATVQPARSERGTELFPVEHEDRCTRCHDPPGAIRGVLEISTDGAPHPATTDDAARTVIGTAVRDGFIQMMTARRADTTPEEFAAHLDDTMHGYFDEMKQRSPAVLDIAVYTATGYPSPMGNENIEDIRPGVSHDAIEAVVASNRARTFPSADGMVEIVPLVNDDRCHNCHRPTDRMRGAIVVVTRATAIPLLSTLAEISELSVRHIMLSGLGRLTTGFLDDVAATGAVGTLRLYDPQARLYHDAIAHPPPPPLVARALRGHTPAHGETRVTDTSESYVFVSPLLNAAECSRCHGPERELRGALEIVIDGSDAVRDRRALRRDAALFGIATMLAVALALYLALRLFVLTPVRRLSEVADRVGAGNLDVQANVSSRDEVGRLGQRLNEMVAGLRERLHLSKFVSQSTLEHVVAAGGTMNLGGQRRDIVVLFSDIRGFTSYSESREPEAVVEMLNLYLDTQAAVVARHGGDIDKFVGDELMALFFGDDAEQRSVRCAVEMVEAVDELNRKRGIEAVAIGVGINSGPAIVGAMGAANRMDFTAIGDTVNLGARLCSNAGRGQVLVSEAVRAKLPAVTEIELEALEPIRVKGKAQPIVVFAAKRKAAA